LINGAAWGSGHTGAAAVLDGSDDYVTVAAPGLPTSDFTYETWVFLDRADVFQTILEALDGLGGAELELDILPGGALQIWSNGAERLQTSAGVPVGTWTHVSLTRSGSTLQTYINGTPASPTGTDASPLGFGNCPLLMGVDADSVCAGALNGFLEGRLDDVRIHNRALTQSEIQADMNTPVRSGS
jgi:hypothetical protein